MPIVSFFIAATIISLERTCWSLCSKRLVFVWTLWNKTSRDAIVPFIYAMTPLCHLLRRVGCALLTCSGSPTLIPREKISFCFIVVIASFHFLPQIAFSVAIKNLFCHGFSTVESQNTSWPHKEDRKFILFNVSLSFLVNAFCQSIDLLVSWCEWDYPHTRSRGSCIKRMTFPEHEKVFLDEVFSIKTNYFDFLVSSFILFHFILVYFLFASTLSLSMKTPKRNWLIDWLNLKNLANFQ